MTYRQIYLLILLTCWLHLDGVSQEQISSDSLERTLNIAREANDPDSILKYSTQVIDDFKSPSNQSEDIILQQSYQLQGTGWRLKGNFDKALNSYLLSLEIANELNDELQAGKVNIEIGNVYSENGNPALAKTYYSRGLAHLRKANNENSLGRGLYNVGDHMFDQEELDSALIYTREARDIFRKHEDKFSEAYSLGNLGRIYAKIGENQRAETHLNEAIELLEDVPDYNSITDFLFAMSEVYSGKGLDKEAIEYAERSLKAAQTYGLKKDLAEVHNRLSQLYAEVGNTAESYIHYKEYIAYRDSIKNLETIENMANLRTESELARKQAEVDLLSTQKNNQKIIVIAAVVAFFLIMLLALGLYRRNKYIGRTKKIIEAEKNRSELLLLNILPHETAQELKEQGHVRPKRFESVSVLFTDFENFTHYAENLTPEELVESVDFYFTKFDQIVEKHGLEKIKTVGDAYMCAAGVPFPVDNHAIRIVAAAFDIIEFVNQSKLASLKRGAHFSVRIGINSGPVVAGVVGSKKFAYDIWGDTVNIASRMESCSEAGRINISENTCQLVNKTYHCEYRGEIKVKNKGMMKMYFVERLLKQNTVRDLNSA